jgi:hypothetical protein
LAGDRRAGAIGLSNFVARNDWESSNGQSGQAFNYYAVRDELVGFYEPFITGSAGGGGGGATGGIRGDWAYSAFGGCPTISFCFGGSSPGSSSTSGLSNVSAGYVSYAFNSDMQANGRISISYVVPAAPPTPTTAPGSSNGTDPAADSAKAPEAPRDIKALALWKSAEVSWQAPANDGNSPIVLYEVNAKTGQTCTSTQLSCRITGLTPGQLLELSVRAKNSVGYSAPAMLQGAKMFIPLSINLWQVKFSRSTPIAKTMNRSQLSSLERMLSQDTGGFVVNVRLARNASKLSASEVQNLLLTEVKALKAQLRGAALLGKVKFVTYIQGPNSAAKRPSVILVIRKP